MFQSRLRGVSNYTTANVTPTSEKSIEPILVKQLVVTSELELRNTTSRNSSCSELFLSLVVSHGAPSFHALWLNVVTSYDNRWGKPGNTLTPPLLPNSDSALRKI